MTVREIFIVRGSCKTYENTVKSPKCMLSFTLSNAAHKARLELLQGQFWPAGLMFDIPERNLCVVVYKNRHLLTFSFTWLVCFWIYLNYESDHLYLYAPFQILFQ